MVAVVDGFAELFGCIKCYIQKVRWSVVGYEVDLRLQSPLYCLWVPVGATSSLRIHANVGPLRNRRW